MNILEYTDGGQTISPGILDRGRPGHQVPVTNKQLADAGLWVTTTLGGAQFRAPGPWLGWNGTLPVSRCPVEHFRLVV